MSVNVIEKNKIIDRDVSDKISKNLSISQKLKKLVKKLAKLSKSQNANINVKTKQFLTFETRIAFT